MINLEVEFKHTNSDIIVFEIRTNVRCVNSGFNYEYFGLKGFHPVVTYELDETPLEECIISSHTSDEMIIIKEWINSHYNDIEDKLVELFIKQNK